MKKALAAIVTIALLGGITIGAAPIATAASPAATPAYSLLEKAYVAAARQYAPVYKRVPSRTLVPVGWMICGQLSGGESVNTVMRPGSVNTFTPGARLVLVASAVAFLCPEYQPAVKRYAATHDL
jgi:hypothetical protein